MKKLLIFLLLLVPALASAMTARTIVNPAANAPLNSAIMRNELQLLENEVTSVTNSPFTLTTSGSSGAATFSSGILNIPSYTGGGSGAFATTSADYWGSTKGYLTSNAGDWAGTWQTFSPSHFQTAGSYQPLATVLTNTTASYTTTIDTRLANTSGTNTGDNSANSLYSGLVTMAYPGAGIALSTGSAWGTSITNNSSRWNSATTTFTSPLVYTLGTNAVTLTTSGTWSGNAGTATALAANGTNCSAGNYPLGIDASGNVESCTAASGGGGTVTQVNTTYPVTGGPFTTSGTIALAFGTTTSNTWAGTQTFTNLITGSISGNAATVTTNANLSGAITSSGNNVTAFGTLGQGILGNPFAASTIPTALATSTLYGAASTGGYVLQWSNAAGGLVLAATSSSGGSGITALTGDVTASGSGSVAATIVMSIAHTWTALQTMGSHLLKATSPEFVTSIDDTNGNKLLKLFPATSAVNYLDVIEGATTFSPGIFADGSDTNVNMQVGGKGTGAFQILDGISGSTVFGNFTLLLSSILSPLVIATTSPSAFKVTDQYGTTALNVNTASTTGPIFTVQATSTTDTLFSVDQYGHLTASSTPATPTVSSCGTGTGILSAGSNDVTGVVTTATAATACTITFGRAYSSIPNVLVTGASLVGFPAVTAISTTAFTIGVSAAVTGDAITYFVVMQ